MLGGGDRCSIWQRPLACAENVGTKKKGAKGNLQQKIPLIIPSHMLGFRCRQCGFCCPRHQDTEDKLPVDHVSHEKIKELYRRHKELGNLDEWIARNSQGTLVVKFRGHRCIHYVGNQCRIHRDYGGEYLPDACKSYPRLFILTSRGVEFSLVLGCPAAAETLFGTKPIVGRIYAPDTKELELPWPNEPLCVIRPEIHAVTDKAHHYYLFERFFIQVLQDRTLPLPKRVKRLCRLAFAVEKIQADNDWPRTVAKVYASLADDSADMLERQDDTANARRLLLKIVNARLKTNCHDFDTVLRQIVSKLGVKSNGAYSWKAHERIKEMVGQTLAGYDHVFENYLVNYILRKGFYRADFRQAAGQMVLMSTLVRFFCIGHAGENENRLNDDILLQSIMEVEQGFVYPGSVVANIQQKYLNNLTDEEQLSVLLSWIDG